MTEPLVSVIIPAYNSGEYIKRCLNSLIAQSHQNWEAIVVIAPSKDNTVELVYVCHLVDNRISFIQEETKSNVATARNTGFEKSKGEYIVFLDADDWMEPTRLAVQTSVFEHHKTYMWCCGGVRSVCDNGTSTTNFVDPTEPKDSLLGILSLMFRRECVVPFDTTLPYFDDVDFFLKIRHLPHGSVPAVITNYLLNTCGLTQTTHPISREITMFKLLIRNGAWEYFPREMKEAVASIGSRLTGVDLVRLKKENLG
jgi:glycosyltransferase involved in cell wall biosynthesis